MPNRLLTTRAHVVRLIGKMQDILPERFDELYEARAGRYPHGWGGTCTATIVEYYQRRVDDYIKAITGLQRELVDSVYSDDKIEESPA